MIDAIKNIAAVAGCISVILALIATINTNFRDWMKNIFIKKKAEIDQDSKIVELSNKFDKYIEFDETFKKALREDMEIQKDFAKDQCRNTIKDIFFKYCDNKKIPLYELKTADSTFVTYHDKLNGNSYISLLFNEIKNWEIDYTHQFAEDE